MVVRLGPIIGTPFLNINFILCTSHNLHLSHNLHMISSIYRLLLVTGTIIITKRALGHKYNTAGVTTRPVARIFARGVTEVACLPTVLILSAYSSKREGLKDYITGRWG